MGSITHTCLRHTRVDRPHSQVSHIIAYITLSWDSPAHASCPLSHCSDLSASLLPCIVSAWGHLGPTGGQGFPSNVHWQRRCKLHLAWLVHRMNQGIPRNKAMSTPTPSITTLSSPDHLLWGGPDVAVELAQLLLKGCKKHHGPIQVGRLKSPSPTPTK